MMHLTPLNVAPFVPTEKKPGDRILTSRRCHVIADNGGIAEDDRSLDEMIYDQTASRDNLLGLLLFLFGVVVVPLCALVVAWRGGVL